MQEFDATPLLDEHYELGEGCRWDDVRSELYWVDVVNGSFYRGVDEMTGFRIERKYRVDGFLSAVAPFVNRDEGWIIGWNQSIAHLDEAGDVSVLVAPEERNAAKVRMNGRPLGRVLHRLDGSRLRDRRRQSIPLPWRRRDNDDISQRHHLERARLESGPAHHVLHRQWTTHVASH